MLPCLNCNSIIQAYTKPLNYFEEHTHVCKNITPQKNYLRSSLWDTFTFMHHLNIHTLSGLLTLNDPYIFLSFVPAGHWCWWFTALQTCARVRGVLVYLWVYVSDSKLTVSHVFRGEGLSAFKPIPRSNSKHSSSIHCFLCRDQLGLTWKVRWDTTEPKLVGRMTGDCTSPTFSYLIIMCIILF